TYGFLPFGFSLRKLAAPTLKRQRCSILGRRSGSPVAAPIDNLLQYDEHGPDRDAGIGEIEDGKRPGGRVEENVVDHVTVGEAIDDIADRAGDDERETQPGENLSRLRLPGEPANEGGHGSYQPDQPPPASGQHREGN